MSIFLDTIVTQYSKDSFCKFLVYFGPLDTGSQKINVKMKGPSKLRIVLDGVFLTTPLLTLGFNFPFSCEGRGG